MEGNSSGREGRSVTGDQAAMTQQDAVAQAVQAATTAGDINSFTADRSGEFRVESQSSDDSDVEDVSI